MTFWFKVKISLNVFFLLPLILIMVFTSSGIGFWLSSLSIQYRDVRHAVPFLSQLLMYLAPVAWPASIIHEKYGELAFHLFGLFPMVGVIEGFRSALIGTNEMPIFLILISTLSSILIFLSGILYFSYRENVFTDVS